MVTMARKKPLAATAANTSKEYWEQVLNGEGLSMDAGTHRFRDKSGVRKYRTSYVGGPANVDAIYEMLVGKNGKVKPTGSGPDEERTMP
jgi:hypothetical protein